MTPTKLPPGIEKLKCDHANQNFPKHKPPLDKETEEGHKLITNIFDFGFDTAANIIIAEAQKLVEALEHLDQCANNDCSDTNPNDLLKAWNEFLNGGKNV